MDAITLLHSRNSVPKLGDPAPGGEVLEDMLQAAFRAPDHAWLRPWRFLTIEGAARNRLGDLFVAAASQRKANNNEAPLSADESLKLAAKTLRAPLIIVAVASIESQSKVPAVEQLISAGCAAHGMLLAAHAHGFGAVWRTGDNAYDPHIKAGLGLSDNEEIVGYLYVGTPQAGYKPLPQLSSADFCERWTG